MSLLSLSEPAKRSLAEEAWVVSGLGWVHLVASVDVGPFGADCDSVDMVCAVGVVASSADDGWVCCDRAVSGVLVASFVESGWVDSSDVSVGHVLMAGLVEVAIFGGLGDGAFIMAR